MSSKSRLGSGFEQLEAREVPTASTPDFRAMLDDIGVADQVRTALLDIHDENATLASSLLSKHTTIASLETAVLSLSGNQTYAGIGSITPVSADRFTPFRKNITISAEVNPSSLSTSGIIASKYDSSQNDRSFCFSVDHDQLVFYVYRSDGAYSGVVTTAGVLTANTWQNVSASFNGQNLTIAVNGQNVSTTVLTQNTITEMPNGPAPIRTGEVVGGNGNVVNPFPGGLRNVSLSSAVSQTSEATLAAMRADRDVLLGQLADFEIAADALDPPPEIPMLSLSGDQTFTGIGSVAPTSADQFAPFRNNFTVHAEINPSALTAGIIVSKYDSSTGDRAFCFSTDLQGTLVLYVYGAGGIYTGVATAPGVITANTWQNVSASFDGHSLSIAVNGQTVPTTVLTQNTIAEMPNGSAPIRVGTVVGGNGTECNPFPGSIRGASMTTFGGAAPDDEAEDPTIAPPSAAEILRFALDAIVTVDQARTAVINARNVLTQANAEYMSTLQPRMEVVSINGAQITLNLRLPPAERANVAMQYGVSDKTISVPRGTVDTQVTMTLTSYAPIRRIYDVYDLILSIDGQQVDSFAVSWNPATQSLGVLNQSRAYTEPVPPDSILDAQAAVAAFEARLAELDAEAVIQGAEATTPLDLALTAVEQLSESQTRSALGEAIIAHTNALRTRNDLAARIAVLQGSISGLQAQIDALEAEIAPHVNNPANGDFVALRLTYINRFADHIRENREEMTQAEESLIWAEEDVADAALHLQAVTQHFGSFVGPTEAARMAAWVSDRLAEARLALPDMTFAEWTERFAAENYTVAPLVYQWTDISEPGVIRGFEENALRIAGLSRPVAYAVRECLQTMHPELFGANAAEDRMRAQAWATAHGVNLDFAIGEQQRLSHDTTQSILWMNEHIGPVVSAIFQDLLRQNLGLPRTPLADPMAQIFWTQQFAQHHMRFAAAGCIPTNSELIAAVRDNFDTLYAAYGAMHGQQVAMYQAQDNRSTYGTSTQASEAQFLRDVQELLGSTGNGSLTSRFSTYAKAFPAEAIALQKRIQAGEMSVDVRLRAYVLALNPNTFTVSTQAVTNTLVAGGLTVREGEVGIGGSASTDYAPGAAVLLSTLESGISGTPSAEAISAAEVVAGRAKRSLYDQALHWLDSASVTNAVFSIAGNAIVRTDTAAGKILAGAMNGLWNSSDLSSRWTMAFMAQALTDIPANRFMTAIQGSTNAATFADAMVALMSDAQYSHLLASSSFSSSEIIMVAPDRSVYTDPSRPVRLRFDLPTSLQNIRRIAVLEGSTILAQSAAGTFIDVTPTKSGIHNLTLRITTDEGVTQTIAVAPIEIRFGHVPDTAEGLRYLSSSPLNTAIERDILNHMRFPVEGAGWKYGTTSGAHTGNGVYALDLNGNDDDQAVIRAPATGFVKDVDLIAGKITIASSLEGGAAWETTFYHLDHILGETYEGVAEAIHRLGLDATYGLTPSMMTSEKLAILRGIPEANALLQPVLAQIALAEAAIDARIAAGLRVGGWEVIGQGGNEGDSTGPHTHVEVTSGGKPVNLFAWANLYHEEIDAEVNIDDRDDMIFEYNNSLGTLVNAAERIAVIRQADGTNTTYAWQNGVGLGEMQRIVWDLQVGWIKFGEANPTEKWENGSWVSL